MTAGLICSIAERRGWGTKNYSSEFHHNKKRVGVCRTNIILLDARLINYILLW